MIKLTTLLVILFSLNAQAIQLECNEKSDKNFNIQHTIQINDDSSESALKTRVESLDFINQKDSLYVGYSTFVRENSEEFYILPNDRKLKMSRKKTSKGTTKKVYSIQVLQDNPLVAKDPEVESQIYVDVECLQKSQNVF